MTRRQAQALALIRAAQAGISRAEIAKAMAINPRYQSTATTCG